MTQPDQPRPDRDHRPSCETLREREMAALRASNTARIAFEARNAADPARQWTDDDVAQATPAELAAAFRSGQLAGLGIGARRRRGDHRPAHTITPGAA